jgi:hypothetical protein
MLSVANKPIMLSVIMLNVDMLSVMAPSAYLSQWAPLLIVALPRNIRQGNNCFDRDEHTSLSCHGKNKCITIFVQMGFSSNTEQTARQSSGPNLFCTEFRLTDKKSSGPQMKLTRLESNHNWIILYVRSQDYMLIKKVKLKVSFDKSWVENDEMK